MNWIWIPEIFFSIVFILMALYVMIYKSHLYKSSTSISCGDKLQILIILFIGIYGLVMFILSKIPM